MRVVLDTNVVVSALIWGSKPYTLLQVATEGAIVLYTSPALIEVLHDVLGRGHLRAQLHRQQASVETALSLYAGLAISVTPALVTEIVASDPDDDHVIAAAIAAEEHIIVSGDRHLLDLVTHGTIRIMTPAHAPQAISVAAKLRSPP